MSSHRARSVVAVALAAALPLAVPALGASTSPSRTQACPLPILGADPDTVTLTGPTTLTPADHRLVGYTLAAAETPGEKGDGLPHGVSISYRITGTGGYGPATGSAHGDFRVPVRFGLRATRDAGGKARTYTIAWTASFDGGPHTCSSSDASHHPFVVVVPARSHRQATADGFVMRAGGQSLTVDDTGGDPALQGSTLVIEVDRDATVRRDGASVPASRIQPGDRITAVGSVDDAGRLRATSTTATSPPQPDAAGAPSGPTCAGSGACAPTLAHITIQDYTFSPPVQAVPAYTLVEVDNLDGFGHTVTGNHLASGVISGGSSFLVEFTRPGTYRFFCSIHPFMNGALEVH